MNHGYNMPPGADAELMRIEREQEATVKRLNEISREYWDDPSALAADYPGEHHVRLARMLKYVRDRHLGRISPSEFEVRMKCEYDAVLSETTRFQAGREGVL